MDDRKNKVSVRLTDEELKRLEEIAEKRNTTQSAIIRDSINSSVMFLNDVNNGQFEEREYFLLEEWNDLKTNHTQEEKETAKLIFEELGLDNYEHDFLFELHGSRNELINFIMKVAGTHHGALYRSGKIRDDK